MPIVYISNLDSLDKWAHDHPIPSCVLLGKWERLECDIVHLASGLSYLKFALGSVFLCMFSACNADLV